MQYLHILSRRYDENGNIDLSKTQKVEQAASDYATLVVCICILYLCI